MTTGFRWTHGLGIGAVAVFCACYEGDRAAPGVVDTPGMREALTLDLRAAEADLAALVDSIHAYLGDASAAVLLSAGDLWEEYRRVECESLRAVFEPGTLGPVAQLTCLVEVTDDRRRLLGGQYDFIPAPGAR
jgi:hypothetical protein